MGQSLNWDNKHFVNYYNTCAYKLQKNLEHPNNIIHDLCNLEKVDSIGYMTSKELKPEVSADLYKIIEERNKQKINKKISTQHHCVNCGNWRTTEQEIQARGLDEGTTLIITCETENCFHRWTMTS